MSVRRQCRNSLNCLRRRRHGRIPIATNFFCAGRALDPAAASAATSEAAVGVDAQLFHPLRDAALHHLRLTASQRASQPA